jgi:hypothetical protein
MIEFLSENTWIIQVYMVSMVISVFYYALIYDGDFTIDQFFGAFFPVFNTAVAFVLLIMAVVFLRANVQLISKNKRL